MHKGWYEAVLSRELGMVSAPDELWERVRNPKPRAGVYTSVNAARMIACAAVMVLFVIWLYPSRREIRSADVVAVRAWLRANAGVDVPLRSHLPAGLQLTGARIVNGRAEIAYLVSGRECLAIRQPAPAKHRFTLSCTNLNDSKVACALCHIG